VRTSSLFEETHRIAEFLDIEPGKLTPPPKNVNQSEVKSAPFDNINDGLIESVARDYCWNTWNELKKMGKYK
jgi:hypothetical protein